MNKKSKLIWVLAAGLLLSPSAEAKKDHILPIPQQIKVNDGVLRYAAGSQVTVAGIESHSALQRFFEEFGVKNVTFDAQAKEGNVVVEMVESIAGSHQHELGGYADEAYVLKVTAAGIHITATTEIGVIRAAQTLTQLAEGYEESGVNLEQVEIADWPAFKLRGYMHDVGRSYIDFETLKKHVDLLSRFKVNTFHWHMTENQAWRFEVKAYPQLTKSSTMTRHEGKFYTQEQCRELQEFAYERGMYIIPEIDMPGHSEAFVRAMGVDMQSAQGKVILKKVLDEVVEVFNRAPYIHIGADEKATTAAYVNEMLDYIKNKGMRCMVWNPISGVSGSATHADLCQLWSTAGASVSGKHNVDCRYNYTNHFDVFADLVGIYKSTIYYKEKGDPTVSGTISGMWNDRKLETQDDIIAQNNFFANVIASASRAWQGGGKRYIDNGTNGGTNFGGGVMLPSSGEEFEDFQNWENRFLFHKAHSLKGQPIPYVKQTNVRWRITDAFSNGGNANTPFLPEQMMLADTVDLLPDTYVQDGKTYGTGMATGAGIYLRHTWGQSIINAYYKNPNYGQTAYAWTYVYSPKAQTVGAQIEFQNYSRSEQDSAPAKGQWDVMGSKIWLNGQEIPAPTYANTGVSITNKEVTLKNENFPARKPIAVSLNEGWNLVFMKLPYINAATRLDKWMFTCVFTDLEGFAAVDGLIYSPNKCLDATSENLMARISEIKTSRNNLVKNQPGYYPEEVAAELDRVVAEIEATLQEQYSEDVRQQQTSNLEKAYAAFQAALATASVLQPQVSTENKEVLYTLSTPLRGNRYAASNGANAQMVGKATAEEVTYWKFEKRNDGTLDIVNKADGTYVSPDSPNNTALKTQASSPSAGWTFAPADEVGYFIITSGEAQFNQTQSTLGWKIYNWGSGTNTTDAGCKYSIAQVSITEEEVLTPVLELTSDQIGTSYPYTLSEADAKKIYALEELTIALQINTQALSGRQALVATSDPTQPVNTSAEGMNSRYVAYGMNNSDGGYLASWKSGDRFTGGASITANAKDLIVVYVVNPLTRSFKFYVNGVLGRSWDNAHADGFMAGYEIASPGMVKADHPNAQIYIGGGKHSGGSGEVFNGTITGVKVYQGALSESEVAAIRFTATGPTEGEEEEEEVSLKDANEFENGGVYTFVTTRGWMGAKADNNNVISTAYTANGVTGSQDDPYFQWTVYKSPNNNYYLYNLGKQMYMGKESNNNTAVPFIADPVAQDLTFKKSSNANYPIMFSTDGSAVVNHSANHASGLISWTGGWNNLTDDGSNHQVTLVKTLTDAELQAIADHVAQYEKSLFVKVEVEDWTESNPNTHFGSVTATYGNTASSTPLTLKNMTASAMKYHKVGDNISFTRAYRGFEFQGFYLGTENLGKSFTLTEEHEKAITETHPLIAKFTPTEEVTLFYDDDPKSYRIPAIATTGTGRVVAVSDYRHSLDDIGRDVHGTGSLRIDLVMRYSDDNGVTWSKKQTIAEGTDDKSATGYDCAYGDAAIAAVGKNVLVMAAAGNVCYPYGSATSHNRTVRLFSADNGETWSKEDISEKMFISSTATIPNGHTAFFGSGKLAVDADFNGTGKARIYGGMLVKDQVRTTNVYVVYTDDLGENWKVLGGVKAAEADEPKVEILPNGQILLSARRQGGRLFNVFTYGTGVNDKANGTGKWNGTANGCNNGGNNGTNGEIFLVDAQNTNGETVKLLMQSQPKGGSGHYDRKDVTIWYKEVNANTTYTTATIKDRWTEGMQVSYQQSSYSVATLQADGRIGFFFEEAPCYGDDYTKGYCMVYVPLTIEKITKGNYSTPDLPTAIEGITVKQDNHIYDLAGRKVTQPNRGSIYIINGQKVYVK